MCKGEDIENCIMTFPLSAYTTFSKTAFTTKELDENIGDVEPSCWNFALRLPHVPGARNILEGVKGKDQSICAQLV
jgi:hypothetical protein